MYFGYFLIFGAVIGSALMAFLPVPGDPSGSGYGFGSMIGRWVGSFVSVGIGLAIVLHHIKQAESESDG